MNGRDGSKEASIQRGDRSFLIHPDVARHDFGNDPFAGSHGALDHYLGAGILYYALGYLSRSQVSICIGSGGGFVPSLMRRAQLDIGIDPSVTMLIDADIPDLAFGSPHQPGGWLTTENTFLQRESDILVLPMLSRDAAKILTTEGIGIDYLHIDGDHSRTGVLADFKAYAPLLTQQGMITLHDYRLPSVSEAVREILESYPGWEHLTFPEVGTGTILLRRALPPDVPRQPQNWTEFTDKGRKTTLAQEELQSCITEYKRKSRFTHWQYLTTSAYRLRYVLAMEFIDQTDCTVVEVGGYPNTVVRHLQQASVVHLVEPYAPQEYVAEVEALAAEAGTTLFLHQTNLADSNFDSSCLGAFNLVLLGLDISPGCETREDYEQTLVALLRLISSANRVALEIPDRAPSKMTWTLISEAFHPTLQLDVTLDYGHDPVADAYYVKDNRSLRRLILFSLEDSPCPTTERIRSLVHETADALWKIHIKLNEPHNYAYCIGTTIDFTSEGNADGYKAQGWVGAEKDHSWMIGDESVLFLSFDEKSMPSIPSVALEMDLKPLLAPGLLERQRVTVTINNFPFFSLIVTEPGTININIPTDILRGQQPIKLLLQHPDARRPCDINPESTDRKLLSVAVRKLVFKNLQQITENHDI